MADLSILDSIDGALRDWETSEDAMRWVPEEGRREEPPAPPLAGRVYTGLVGTSPLDSEVTYLGYTTDGAAFRPNLTPASVAAEMSGLYRLVMGDFLHPQEPLDLETEPVRELTLPHSVEVSFTVPLDEHHARVAAEFMRTIERADGC